MKITVYIKFDDVSLFMNREPVWVYPFQDNTMFPMELNLTGGHFDVIETGSNEGLRKIKIKLFDPQ